MAREFIEGAAADELSMRWNREAHDRMRLNPRVLRDVSPVDTRESVLGLDLPFPTLVPGARPGNHGIQRIRSPFVRLNVDAVQKLIESRYHT